MTNKLKITLRCARYMLVAILVALPFVAPEDTEAKRAVGDGYTQAEVYETRCASNWASICYDAPGDCSTLEPSCLVEGWNDY